MDLFYASGQLEGLLTTENIAEREKHWEETAMMSHYKYFVIVVILFFSAISNYSVGSNFRI